MSTASFIVISPPKNARKTGWLATYSQSGPAAHGAAAFVRWIAHRPTAMNARWAPTNISVGNASRNAPNGIADPFSEARPPRSAPGDRLRHREHLLAVQGHLVKPERVANQGSDHVVLVPLHVESAEAPDRLLCHEWPPLDARHVALPALEHDGRHLGETLECAVRVYLTGRVCVDAGSVLLDQRASPGRQGRLAFAYLAIEHRPVPREELADTLWGGAPPAAWDGALNALDSKLRAMLRRGGLGADALTAAAGCYELRLPPDTWLDIEAAASALHEAEATLRAGDHRAAWAAANVAYHIARRPLLPGEGGEWVERERERLRAVRVRATECFAASSLLNGEPQIGVALAEEVIAEEPFRESGYQLLMRAHAAVGNRGDALLAYERCRRVLAEELGADPSPETRALHLKLLGNER
ncbi:MAG: hypothetical protein EXR65_05795 [Dehalococcoidia bacterium]|nr:hypothetical protein [Dehalococcoidia bacterium]